MLSTQDLEVLEILEELEGNAVASFTGNKHKCNIDHSRMKRYFCSDTIFNLINKVLREDEIKILEKSLNFAPIQRKVNEPELTDIFQNFCRFMRIKQHFRNEPSDNFSEKPEVFLSEVEIELFKITKEPNCYFNVSLKDWRAIRTLAGNLPHKVSCILYQTDKVSCIVVCDRADSLKEIEKQLLDKKVYQEVDTSNKFFKGLKTKKFIAEKELKYLNSSFT